MAIIIYVHGTNAKQKFNRTVIKGAGPFQAKSGMGPAEERALKRLAGFPHATVIGFFWNGQANSTARKDAAAQLYPQLKLISGQPIVLVGHSHGGNVIGHALCMCLANDTTVDSVYLFATPIMTGVGKAWIEGGSINRVGNGGLHTFSNPKDTIQVKLARVGNFFDKKKGSEGIDSSVGRQIPTINDISISPRSIGSWYSKSAHSAMRTAEAFNMAAQVLGK